MQTAAQRCRHCPDTLCCILTALTILASIATARGADGLTALPTIPDVGEPFDVKKFCSVSVPYGQNAYIAYRHAAASFVGEYEVLRRTNRTGDVDWKPYNASLDNTLDKGWQFANADVRRWLEANDTTLDAWQRGTECSYALDLPEESGVVSPNDNAMTIFLRLTAFSGHARDFARLACLKAARLSVSPRPADAWTWYCAVFRSSAHLSMLTGLNGRLVGHAVYYLAADGTRRWAEQPQVTAGDLRRALADVRDANAMYPPFSESLKGDYLSHTHNLDGCIEVGVPYLGEYLPYFGYRRRAMRALNLVYANLLSEADRPRRERSAICGKLGLFSGGRAAIHSPTVYSGEEIERRFLVFPPDVKIVQSVLLPTTAMFEVFDNECVKHSSLILDLALQLYFREHGQFPATLDELVRNGYLKSIPADPYGPGGPFHYRRDSNPQDGAVLWSVAKDGINQHGRLDLWREHSDGSGDQIFQVRPPRHGS
jgi:hypothetical protein